MLIALLSCAWEAPLNDNPLSAPPLLNAIEGTVVFGGTGDLGPTFVTVYDAANPGPPAGTGGPVTFGAVSPDGFTGDGAGIQSASYQITQLADGGYLLNSLVDVDRNFSPFTDVLAGATCGDWGGTHVTDLVTLAPAPVTVKGGVAKHDVTIFVGSSFATQRPAFAFEGAAQVSLAEAILPIPPVYTLAAASVTTALSEEMPLELGPACPPDAAAPTFCDAAAMAPCSTALWVYAPDADADGQPDPYPSELQASAGLFDVFPRVYVEYVGEPLPMFDHAGKELPERWVGESYPLAREIAIAEQTGGSAADVVPVGVPTPMSSLSVTFSPVFRHYHAEGAFGVDANGPYDLIDLRAEGVALDDVPHGDWRVTVILHTGQTWNVPNDIAALGLPGLGDFDPATQGETLQIGP